MKANVSQGEAEKIDKEIISCVKAVTAFSIHDKADYTQRKVIGMLWGSMKFVIFDVFCLGF